MKDTTQLRREAMEIFRHALRAVDPVTAVKRHLVLEPLKLRAGGQEYDLRRFRSIFVVGMGKASAAMAKAVEEILGDRLTGGQVNVKYGYVENLSKVALHEAGHPVPDQAGLEGARKIVGLLERCGADDLVLCLISGGGSALLPLPVEGVTLEEKQEVTKLLLRSGVDIKEINAIRKHLSKVKGGHLARIASPATVVSLIVSDVIGDPLDSIASGPTAPDETTFSDCLEILSRHHLLGSVPPSIRRHLDAGVRGEIPETPKRGDPVFERVQNVLIASNRIALDAARTRARELGYDAMILSSFVEGETREVARVHAAIAKEIRASGNPLAAPACVISGGETTVTVQGQGRGGRNQEFVLAAALDIAGLERTVIFSAGTDGTDGPTDAAGAIADGDTLSRAKALGLNPRHSLAENDSYSFFERLGDLVTTGPTNTNVMDLHLILIG